MIITYPHTEGAQISGRPVVQATEFCRVAPNIFFIVIFFFTCQSVSVYMHRSENTDNTEVCMALQQCGSSVWKLLHTSLLVLGISRRLLHFGKICGPLFIPNFMWVAWKICLIFAVRSKTEFRFSTSAIVFCVVRNNDTFFEDA